MRDSQPSLHRSVIRLKEHGLYSWVWLAPAMLYSSANAKLGLIWSFRMRSWWLLGFFGVLYVLSLLTLSRVQHRWISKFGWRVFKQKSFRELYWDGLTRTERWLVYPGIVAFVLMLLALTTLSLLFKLFR